MSGPASAQIKTVQALLRSQGVAALPGEVLTIFGGEVVRVTTIVEYRGPAIEAQLYAAIGNRGITFDEIWYGIGAQAPFPASSTFIPVFLTADVVTDAQHPGLKDLYVKILNYPEAGMPELADCINVIGAAEFQNFAITSYEKV